MNKHFNVRNIFIAICVIIAIVVLVLILKGCGAE